MNDEVIVGFPWSSKKREDMMTSIG